MAEHSLPVGKELIAGIKALGIALGYHAVTEHAVHPIDGGSAANDVAWLRDSRHAFPIMIFEVETKTSNSAANNAAKVYGRTDRSKPLFFFHLFVDGKVDAQRIGHLRTLFGMHNYRAYALEDEPVDEVVHDVIAQHRRISLGISVRGLADGLQHSAWRSVDLGALLRKIESLRFPDNDGLILPDYAALAGPGQFGRAFVVAFLRHLKERSNRTAPSSVEDKYETYLGAMWSWIIHKGILAAGDINDGAIRSAVLLNASLDRALEFNVKAEHLGAGQEFDHFVIDGAPCILALLGALTRHIPGQALRLARHCNTICSALTRWKPCYSALAATWALHIAASVQDADEEYERARACINQRNVLPESLLRSPPGWGDAFYCGEGWLEETFAGARVPVPPIEEFRKHLSVERMPDERRRHEAIMLALWALSDELAPSMWSEDLHRLLHAVSDQE